MKKKIKPFVHIKLGQVCIGKKTPQCRTIPHSPNYLNTKHWAIRAAWKDAWKEEVWARWQEQKKQFDVKLPFENANLTVWVFYSGVSQDMDNAFASLKPVVDSLRDCGIIINDDIKHLSLKQIKFVPCLKVNQHIELNIELKK